MTKELPLSRGYIALVDDEDFERVNRIKWSASPDGYNRITALGYLGVGQATRKRVMLHRFILDVPKGMEDDHINRNSLDNRRRNLRICTRKQNSWNRGADRDNTSGYKGVTWSKDRGKWLANVGYNGSNKHAGYFDDPLSAALAYDPLARILHRPLA